jgi:hypothetical protein
MLEWLIYWEYAGLAVYKMFKYFFLDRQTVKFLKFVIYTGYNHRISICLYINVLSLLWFY